MNLNGFLKLLTVLLLVGCVYLLVEASIKSVNEDLTQPLDEELVAPELIAANPESETPVPYGAIDLGAGNPLIENQADSKSRLTVGVLGLTPELDKIPIITEVPWSPSQATKAFNQARDYACQMLTEGVPVTPHLTRPNSRRRGAWGRIPALTVALEIPRDVKVALPAASRGAIDSYLRNHQLAIEPIIYQNEAAEIYFGMDTKAAFYPIADPTNTITPEPLIEQSMGNFRGLGLLRETPEAKGRTLVMAFRFTKEVKDAIAKTALQQPATELLFFHLTQVEEGNIPSLEVFATSDERQTLHRLITTSTVVRDAQPTITATLRFDKMVLLGLYPSNPVVTGFRNHSSAVMSQDTILRLTKMNAEADRMTFQQVLDKFTTLTNSTK